MKNTIPFITLPFVLVFLVVNTIANFTKIGILINKGEK